MGRELAFFDTCQDIVWIGYCLPLARVISGLRGLGQAVLLLGLRAFTVFSVCESFSEAKGCRNESLQGFAVCQMGQTKFGPRTTVSRMRS